MRYRTLVVVTGVVLFASASQGADPPDALLIRVADGQPDVLAVDRPLSDELSDASGILVWTQKGRGRWTRLPLPDDSPQPEPSDYALPSSNGFSRSIGSGGGTEIAAMTAQPDQLMSAVVMRASMDDLITPVHQGLHLDPQVTFRRRAGRGAVKFPAKHFVLTKEPAGGEILRISFPEGQSKLTWAEIPDLPHRLEEGLPPGKYRLAPVEDGPEVTFTIQKPSTRERVMQPAHRLAELLGSREHPLYLQVAVQRLLPFVQDNAERNSYLADAFDLLDQAPEETLTPWLKQLRAMLEARLEGERLPPERDDEGRTGIGAIDRARRQIAAGKWDRALRTLQSAEAEETARSRSLAVLYQAVIAGESGPAAGERAHELFVQAIAELQDGRPDDAFRAHNNYANYLLTRVRDRIHTHAFQIAAGVQAPLFSALNDWRVARDHYQVALDLAQQIEDRPETAVQINMGALYAVLADLIRVLDSPTDGKVQFRRERQVAEEAAHDLIVEAMDAGGASADSVTQGVSHEILAHLAFRQRRGRICLKESRQALEQYLIAGSLAGTERVHRLLGLYYLRGDELEPEGNGRALPEKALNHLMISQVLSESLRNQVPEDRIGLTRAGFFARRSYVYEKIIDLLIKHQEDAKALDYVEAAKARALQDLLAVQGASPDRFPQRRRLSELLADWPNDVVAIEYFLGTDSAQLFLVTVEGKVIGQSLVDQSGDEVSSRELIAHASRFLRGMKGRAAKMRRQVLATGEFDGSWQTELNAFYQQLLPRPMVKEMRRADTVIVVPHHILHYFPFAALVTEPDEAEREPLEMPMPRFLVDEPFHLCHAPSLATWDRLRTHSRGPLNEVHVAAIAEFQQAPSLPGVREDVKNLKQVFGKGARSIHLGNEVSESALGALLDRQGLLFVATHGRNIAQQPLASYLLCHGDENTDGRLTAAEIFNTQVNAGLVVLSACYSALADRSPLPGDDLFGLQRAFLQSGANAVVAGLWDVYDETGPILMRMFLEELAGGQRAAKALAEAQRRFLAERRREGPGDPWIHPYFWAVYTITGSDAVILKQAEDQGNVD